MIRARMIRVGIHKNTLLYREYIEEENKQDLIRELIKRDIEEEGKEVYEREGYKHTVSNIGGLLKDVLGEQDTLRMMLSSKASEAYVEDYIGSITLKGVYIRYLLVKHYKRLGRLKEDYVYGGTDLEREGLDRSLLLAVRTKVKLKRVDLVDKLYSIYGRAAQLKIVDMICDDIGIERYSEELKEGGGSTGIWICGGDRKYIGDEVEIRLESRNYSKLHTVLKIRGDLGEYVDRLLEESELGLESLEYPGRCQKQLEIYLSNKELWKLYNAETYKIGLITRLVKEFYAGNTDIAEYKSKYVRYRKMNGEKYKHIRVNVADLEEYRRAERDFARCLSPFIEGLLKDYYKEQGKL